MIDGVTSSSGTPLNLDHALISLNPVTLTQSRYLMRIVAYLDGGGSAEAPQLLRGVIFDADSGKLIAAGDVVQIENDAPAGWVPLRLSGQEGLELPAGNYLYGIHSGQTPFGARAVIADGRTPVANSYAGVSFAAGTPASIGSPTSHPDGPLAVYLETVQPVKIPENVDDDYLAGLPFPLTQRIFGQNAPLPSTLQTAIAGWYGSAFDETQGANAVVRSDGPLAALVGERVQVKLAAPSRTRTVVVYVHDLAEFPVEIADEDLMLSRRAFIAIANPVDDQALVEIAVMA